MKDLANNLFAKRIAYIKFVFFDYCDCYTVLARTLIKLADMV